MTYNYAFLEDKALSGGVIGKWKGIPIFSISKNDFKKMKQEGRGKTDVYYLIYDDENKLVKNNGVYGQLLPNGDIKSCPAYWYMSEVAAPVPKVVVKANEPARMNEDAADEFSIAAIIDDIDELLKSSCSWSEVYG